MATYNPTNPIAGDSRGSPEAWIAHFRANGAKRMDQVERYVREFYRIAVPAGIGAHKGLAQFIHETEGATSDAWIGSLNPAGIGVTDDSRRNWYDFETGENAARAHLVHLALYVFGALPDVLKPYRDTDPRASAVGLSILGKRKTLASFGGSTPQNPTWAVDPDYGEKWATTLNRLEPVFADDTPPAPSQPAPPKEKPVALAVKKRMVPTTNRNHPNTLLNDTGDLFIIVHETGNTGAGTGARMHADFVMNGGGSSSVAFHLTVDHIEAYQMFALKWIGWHASDGCNSRTEDWGCFRGIAIETCVNDGNRHKDQTRRNLATLIYMIITGDPSIDFGGVDHRRFSVDRIRTHNQTAFDRKWCPTYMLNDGYVPVLVTQVRSKLSGVTGAPVNGIGLGDTAEVTEALNVRKGAGTGHAVTGTLMPGTRVTVITDGTTHVRSADGYTWLNVSTALGTGWVASEWLRKEVVAPPPKPVEYAPRVIIPELAALTVADRDTAAALVLKNGIHFVTVWDEVEAIDTAVNLQFAYQGAKKTEPDSPKGTRRWVSHVFEADDKRWYYYDERGNRLLAYETRDGKLVAPQWKRVNDAPDVDALVASLTGTLENAVA